MKKLIYKIVDIERSSDELSRNIIKRIIEIIRAPSDRANMFKMIDSLEVVTKKIEATAHRINMGRELKVPETVKDKFIHLADSVAQTVKSLENMVHETPFYIENMLRIYITMRKTLMI